MFSVHSDISRCFPRLIGKYQFPIFTKEFSPSSPVLPPRVLKRLVTPHVLDESKSWLDVQYELDDVHLRMRPPNSVVERCPSVVVAYPRADTSLVKEELDDLRGRPPARNVEQALAEAVAAPEAAAGLVYAP